MQDYSADRECNTMRIERKIGAAANEQTSPCVDFHEPHEHSRSKNHEIGVGATHRLMG